MAPECGGITICPHGAITYDENKKRPVWNRNKCTFCLKCTTQDACPIGCILYARNDKEKKRIESMVKEDPKKQSWLWKERFGVEPAKTEPFAKVITDQNLKNFNTNKLSVIDVWHEEYLDCRLHAPLFEDLFENWEEIDFYKINAGDNPDLVKEINIQTFPTLLIHKNGKEIYRKEGFINEDEVQKIKREIQSEVQFS